MLAFTEQQMDRMATESFLERMIGAIAESDPTADAELRGPDGNRILHEQYEKAHSYGLTTELELGQYIVTAWLLGTDFDTRFRLFSKSSPIRPCRRVQRRRPSSKPPRCFSGRCKREASDELGRAVGPGL